jgi:hypothetical protein
VICRVINRMEDVSVTALKLRSNADLSDASPRYSQDWHRSSHLVSCCMQPSIPLAEDVLFTLSRKLRVLEYPTKSRLREVADRSI